MCSVLGLFTSVVASKYPERVLKSLARGQEMQRATLAHLRHSFLPADSREWRGDEWGRLNPFFVHLPDLGEQPLQLPTSPTTKKSTACWGTGRESGAPVNLQGIHIPGRDQGGYPSLRPHRRRPAFLEKCIYNQGQWQL